MTSASKSSFFRQGGWMVMTTFLGGILMVVVQRIASKQMAESEWNAWNVLLRLLIVFGGVPAAALQTMFAQQAAAAVTKEKTDELSATTRGLLKAAFFLWLVIAGVTFVFTEPLASLVHVSKANAAALRLTAMIVVSVIWIPIMKGLLQGLHRFTSLGWLQILEGGGRCATMLLVLLLVSASATGGILAVLAGQYVTLAVAIYLTRDIWSGARDARFSWREWMIRGIPLTLGMGSYVFMQSIDTIFVNSIFIRYSQEPSVKFYTKAMLTGYAIIMFIAPITNVMFPRLVRSLALAEKSNMLTLTVMITGGFACVAALGATLFPRLPLIVIFHGDPGGAARLVPWFAWGLLPLTMANVLIQNLLARQRFEAAKWLILVPLVYALGLMAQAPALLKMTDLDAMTRVIQTLGCACLTLFGVAAWFSWHHARGEAAKP